MFHGVLKFDEGKSVDAGACIFMAGGYGIMCSVAQSTAILLAGEGRRGLANSTYMVSNCVAAMTNSSAVFQACRLISLPRSSKN
ncbi:MAG: hypothetical protein HFE76_02000 [Firmicutes bacterium]|nr:hypothetical protein [Bacillota bacterium]